MGDVFAAAIWFHTEYELHISYQTNR